MKILSTATAGELREAVQQLDAESGGTLQFAVFRRAEFPALAQSALAGTPQTQRAAFLVQGLLDRVRTERTRQVSLCGACPRQLRRGVGAVCVAIPMVDQPTSGMAVGLCTRCAATAELAHTNGTAALRRIWPSLDDRGPLHHAAGRA